MQKELENVANTTTQREIVQLGIEIDNHTIKILEEYIAGL